MTTLHYVKRANKHYPAEGIRKGDPYFWYKHRVNGRGGPKIRCKNRPPRSALTSSPFLACMMDAEDRLWAAVDAYSGVDLAEVLRGIAETVDDKTEECIRGKEDMEKVFASGCPTLDLLQERIEACEELTQTLHELADEAEKGNAIDVSEIRWPQ